MLSLCVMAIAVAGSNGLAMRLTSGGTLDEDLPSKRAPNVVVVSKDPQVLPRKAPSKSLWLIGNSHTYALPGLQKGEPLRNDPGVTLIDELATQLAAVDARRANATYYRIANPNLLPFEMLTRVAHLVHRGFAADVLVLGLTWRNVARDSAPRHEISQLFGDAEFTGAFKKMLIEVNAPPPLFASIDAEVRAMAHQAQAERMRSTADRLDERVTGVVGSGLALVGQSAGLRATVYRAFAYQLAAAMPGDGASQLNYDVVSEDLAINTAALEAMIRMLRARGTSVVVYLAPERTDLPPLMDPKQAEAFRQGFAQFLTSQGAALVDARDAVPNELWGWEQTTPDRSHFTEPGHQKLAHRVIESADRAGSFATLEGP